MTFLTAVIAVSTTAYAIISLLLWHTNRKLIELTRDMFEITNRPHVGVETIVCHIEPEDKSIAVIALIRNVGTAPALNFRAEWIPLINSCPQPVVALAPEATGTLLPGAMPVCLDGAEGRSEVVKAILSGASTLEFVIDITYDGVAGKHHHNHQKSRFHHQFRRFITTESKYD
jgi:hypothetical protein